MTRILGSRGSTRRRGTVVVAILSAVTLVGMLFASSAFAVHDVGIFQLDGNALSTIQSNPTALEDWDNIFTGSTVADPSSFTPDAFGQATDTIYTTGGSKDDLNIPKWRFKNAAPSPDKDDLEHGFAAEYLCSNVPGCTGTSTDKFIYFGADRFTNSGDANIAFWFFQKQVKLDGNGATTDVCTNGNGCSFTGTHTQHGPGLDGITCYPGQTGGSCPGAGADDTRGDILVVSSFTHGGTEPGISLYEWVGVGNAPANLCVTNDCSVVPIPVPGANSADGCLTAGLTGDAGCALVNTSAIDPGGWAFSDKANGAGQIQTSEFYEGGLNLTQLGLANECFSSFLVNTRSSQSVNAELHDFVLGQLRSCVPGLTTVATPNSTSVSPGQAVFDTARVQVAGGSNAPDPTGTVTFKMCYSASATPTCTAANSTIGAGSGLLGDADRDGVIDDSTPNDGDAIAKSANVNTAANPLQPGFYCFRATWPGDDNYPGALAATNQDTECFEVLQHATTTVTDPSSTTFRLGNSVTDHAIVTDSDTGGGDPTGTVDFYVCDPTEVTGTGSNAHCAGTGATGDGTLVNSVTPLTPGPGADQSQATSDPVTPDQLGVWCFRATYTPDTTFFTGSSGDENRECFTVTARSSGTSAQKWLPNDRVVISTTTGTPLAGTLSIELRSGTCDGTVVYTETTGTGSVTAPLTVNTKNTTFFVRTANPGTFYWRIVFTPDSPFATGFTKCETSTVTVNDNP
jgi:hypothetical protein